MPTRKVVRERINKVAAEVHTLLRQQFASLWGTIWPALTTDHWTSKSNVGYAAITIHWVDSDWKLCSCTLGV